MIAPPYTSDFVQLFLPILENDSIAGTIRTEGEHDPVAEFIGEFHAACFSDSLHSNRFSKYRKLSRAYVAITIELNSKSRNRYNVCFKVLCCVFSTCYWSFLPFFKLIASQTSSWLTEAETTLTFLLEILPATHGRRWKICSPSSNRMVHLMSRLKVQRRTVKVDHLNNFLSLKKKNVKTNSSKCS